MQHPRDMEHYTLVYYIRNGLVDCYAIDFLSDRAQDSLIRFLAAEVQAFYRIAAEYKENDWKDWWEFQQENTPVFEKATLRHPLGAVFGETMAKAVNAALLPVFEDLESLHTPKCII